MTELRSFFIVLFAGLVFAGLFRRLHVPWVITLIIGGMIIGPFGLGIFEATPVISFLADIGIVFLMFMAGLETKVSSLGKDWWRVIRIALLNGGIPLVIGLGIGFYFGFSWEAVVLLGIVFISSSIAVVVPSLEANYLLYSRLGKTVVAATMIQDIVSLFLLSIVLKRISPLTELPVSVFLAALFLVVGALVGLRLALPKLRQAFQFMHSEKRGDPFERELRLTVAVLIGTVLFFELIGLHAIVAGFLVGFFLSDIIQSEVLLSKIRVLGYGIFIPIFFILVGAQTNLGVFAEGGAALVLTATVVAGSVFAKFISGWLGARLSGFSGSESGLIGSATIPQLSTTLAVVFTAHSLGLFSPEILTAMTTLSILTTFAGPLLIHQFAKRIDVAAAA